MNTPKVQTSTSQHDLIPEDEIIELTTYHRRDFDLAVIHINRRAHEPVRSTITQPLKAPSTSLGQLDVLHLELIHEICLYLDIESLIRFRQVSRRAQQSVGTSRFYRETTTHALDALCTLLRTKVGSQFTLTELFTALCTRDCLLCGSSFGGFLFLPTLLRCCFSCIQKDRLPRLVPYADAKWYISSKCKTASKTYSLLKSLPILRTIPGIYSMQELSSKGRRQLVTMDDLIRVVGSKRLNHIPTCHSWRRLPYLILIGLVGTSSTVFAALDARFLWKRVLRRECVLGLMAWFCVIGFIRMKGL